MLWALKRRERVGHKDSAICHMLSRANTSDKSFPERNVDSRLRNSDNNHEKTWNKNCNKRPFENNDERG